MKCQNCNQEVPDSANVCGYCGTKLEKKEKRYCPECGKEVPGKAKVCGFCGAPLVQSAQKEKTSKPTPKQTAATPEVKSEAVKPEKKIAQPKVKGKTRKLKIPKWAFAVIGGVILVALVLLFVFPTFSSKSEGGASANVLPFSGNWTGQIEGVNNDFSATLEINFKRNCSIGEICGSYKVFNQDDFGDLELVSVTNDVYKFQEHSKGPDPLPGVKYQTMHLVGDTLRWSFKQTVPPYYESTGTMYQK